MKNYSLEEIIKSIRGRFEEEKITEPINYEEKEKEFWEKYEKHIENGNCQFWWYNKFCNKKARENYECILCNFPCCPDCYRKKMKDRHSRLCFNCGKDFYTDTEFYEIILELLKSI